MTRVALMLAGLVLLGATGCVRARPIEEWRAEGARSTGAEIAAFRLTTLQPGELPPGGACDTSNRTMRGYSRGKDPLRAVAYRVAPAQPPGRVQVISVAVDDTLGVTYYGYVFMDMAARLQESATIYLPTGEGAASRRVNLTTVTRLNAPARLLYEASNLGRPAQLAQQVVDQCRAMFGR